MSVPLQGQDAIIRVAGLTKRFGDFTAVNNVSFEVGRGEIFGYLGANGAGKTTTIRMLCGLVTPTSGTAVVAGADVATSPRAVKRVIGYMSQRFSLYPDLSIEENLAFFAGAYGLSGARRARRVAFALEHAGLTDMRRAITGDLPGGTRQRLALASALLHEPAVIYLDEPTAGVDPASRRDFWRIIRALAREGTTIFVTTHHLDEAEYCNRVGMMIDGALIALDSPDGLKRTYVPGTIWAVDGTDAKSLSAGLAGQTGILQVQPFGDRVHVRVGPDVAGEEELRRRLAGAGVATDRMSFESVEATLEDVFLEMVSGSRVGDVS